LKLLLVFGYNLLEKETKKLNMFIVFSLQIIILIDWNYFFYFHILGRLFQVCHTEKLTDLKKIKNYRITGVSLLYIHSRQSSTLLSS